MADFVAVIRRAVDGLTDNTPEMRVRVYEKARGAVVRQLENMNPRPPEAMFKRQLDKLDAAIRQVEEENAVAAPAEATPDVQPVAEAAAPVEAHQEPAHVEPAAATQVEEQQPTAVFANEPAHVETAPVAVAEPVYRATAVEEPAYAPEPVHEHETVTHHQPVESHSEPAHSVHAEPVHDDHALPAQPTHNETWVAAETAHPVEHVPVADAAHAAHDDPLLSHFEPAREPAMRHAANRVMEEPHVDPESEFPGAESAPVATAHHAAPHSEPWHEPATLTPAASAHPEAAATAWGVDIDREPEAVVEEQPSPPMPRAALTETDVASDFNNFLRNEFSAPAADATPRKEQDEDFSWDRPFDDLPDLPKPVAFEDALHAKQGELASASEQKAAQPRDARSELEDLIGYKSTDSGAASRDNGDRLAADVTRPMSKLEGKSFKVQKKRKKSFNPLPIAFGVVGALAVAGGGYAVYAHRDQVSALVASYMPKDAAPAPAETRALDTESADASKSVTVKETDTAANQPAATETATEDKPTEVASLDPNIATGKFTQRLMTDGTETETDAAKIPVDQSLSEGKTIAGQTEVASANPETTTAEPAVAKPGLAVTQKMFLYEERLGGSPVAVPGTVSWALKNDTTANGGQDQPMIEATVEVPERKLKAVVSFKRNADPSLPASHIIEVVFDLPDDFPEGNVESVQRVAFKQTEQDRGNSLIAVPAKITDDFHMIALNDDADARKVNSELMKTRSWIDIPVIYRNNRRALLTFEKGSSGTEAFDKALAAWAALGPSANSD